MLIGEVQKNALERIRVSKAEYKGHKFIDVRTYFRDDAGEWRPTKKGIAIPPDSIRAVIDLLKKTQG